MESPTSSSTVLSVQSPTDSSVASRSASNTAGSNTSRKGRIPPLRGLVPKRSFDNEDQLIDVLVDRTTGKLRADGVYDSNHKRSTETSEWLDQYKRVPWQDLLSEEFLKTSFKHILQTQSLPLAGGFALFTTAAKMLADDKNQKNVIRTSKPFTPLDQSGNVLLDMNEVAAGCDVTNDAKQNKARIVAGGVGMFVLLWKIELMKEFGDFRNSTFLSTSVGPVILKPYVGVVSSIDEEDVEINTFETRGGQGYERLSRNKAQFYVAVADEGADYPSAMLKDPTGKNDVLFTQDRHNVPNGLLNLVSVTVRFDSMLAPARGRFTKESLVRFIDKMKQVSPLRQCAEITTIPAAEVKEYRKHGQPRPFQYYRYVDGAVMMEDSRRRRVDSPTEYQKPRSKSSESSQASNHSPPSKAEPSKEGPKQHRHVSEGDHTDERRLMRTPLGSKDQARQRREYDRSQQHQQQALHGRQDFRHLHSTTPTTDAFRQQTRAAAGQRAGPFPDVLNLEPFDDIGGFSGLVPPEPSHKYRNVPGLQSVRSGNTRAGEYNEEMQGLTKEFESVNKKRKRGLRSSKLSAGGYQDPDTAQEYPNKARKMYNGY